MTQIQERIKYLVQLGNELQCNAAFEALIKDTSYRNPWFTEPFVRHAVDSICTEFLQENKLEKWLANYPISATHANKTIGIILAGNLPLVGFHDFLCVYILGFSVKIKLSSKDDYLFLAVFDLLKNIDKQLESNCTFVEKLTDFDAVIATGSDNTHRYFEYYFRNYPSILRKSRTSVAVLNGKENPDTLEKLADDIFLYFGFGCRNISALFVPESFDITSVFPYFEKYKWLHHHTKYMNNYDYNRTILLLNNVFHFSNDFLMIQESEQIVSPISCLYFQRYSSALDLENKLQNQLEKLQCICVENVAASGLSFSNLVEIGNAQQPQLTDYADGIDTIQFLIGL